MVSKMPSQRQNDLPFHPGPLRLSVFRESPSPPAKPRPFVHQSPKYDAVFESFVKRRPLSESFARDLSILDISSSSDEDVTDPDPEEPLNLSDTENMASSHNSPSIFSRKRHKMYSSAQKDTRPKSLYDTAKPQPAGSNSKPETGARNSMSEKLSKLMNFKKWGSGRKNSEDHFKSGYERSYEPVPPNVTWTNVVGQNSPRVLTPHPPSTTPTHPVANPRKKRHAPKPPPNVKPYDANNQEETRENSVKNERLTPEKSLVSQSCPDKAEKHENLDQNQTSINQARVTPPPEFSDSLPASDFENESDIGATDVLTIKQSTLDKVPCSENPIPIPQETPAPSNLEITSSNSQDTSEDRAAGLSCAASHISEPSVLQTVVEQQNATIQSAHQGQGAENQLLSTTKLENIERECRKVIDFILETVTNDVKPLLFSQGSDVTSGELSTNNLKVNQKEQTNLGKLTNLPHQSGDITKTDKKRGDITNKTQDDVFDGSEDTPTRKHKHRKSMDNASSGYSSPGSGDEGPISPQSPHSALALPSPTSSYYSSLSASSSRVSNLSRELTLAKPLPQDETQIPAKITEAEQTQEQPQVEKNVNLEVLNETKPDLKPSEPVRDVGNTPENVSVSHESSKIPDSAPVLGITQHTKERTPPFDALPDLPVKLRGKPLPRIRAKSEYIPYRPEMDDWDKESSRVSICMVEKPTEVASLSRAQARLFKQAQNKASKKKAVAAAQKSRAFAMRAKPQWPSHRHSIAAPSNYILDDSELEHPKEEVTSSNLVSHFVSTQNISTYYDGTEQKTVTPQEILTSKREEFFNAFKNTANKRNNEQFGGSVRQLPVSSKEFGFINDVIEEDTETDSPVVTHQTEKSPENTEQNKENLVQRHPSEASSTSSDAKHSSQTSSVCTGSTWSLSTDMTSQVRHRKPSLRRRIQGAFSFQNIRKAISMEKLSESEKRRSMSHYYVNENGSQYNTRQRSATLQEKSSNSEEANLRKAPSISSIISSVRMRKRRSRMRADAMNRYTIADPESCAKNMDEAPERKKSSTLRPVSIILSNTNRRKLEDVGNPSFFRPIGRVIQMNPAEGTLLVEMIKPPSGPFGFYIARKKDSGDSGSVYISRLSDSYPDKMFAGLMRTGDEITEINGRDVSPLTLDQVYDLILDSEKTLLKLKPAQVHIV